MYEALRTLSFEKLLREIAEATISQKPGFFKTLSSATKILSQFFELVKESKIQSLDKPTVHKLVYGTQEDFAVMLSRPKLVAKQSSSALLAIHQSLISSG